MSRAARLLWIAGAAAVLAYPLVFSGAFPQRLGALVLLSAIGASAWNMLGGYAGQISVGHAMFYGIGAYAPLMAYRLWELPPVAGVPAGIAISLVVATIIGLPTFRLVGHYFSMATIAVAELIRIVVSNWDFVGGAIGLMGPATSRTVLDLSFKSSVPYYYLFLAVLAVVLATTRHVERSRLGYYLRAIKAGERAARSLGVPVRRYKLFALLLSAGFTAVAGSLYALMIGFADPDSVFGLLISVEMIIVAALGGAGTLFGPLIGAAILVPLREFSNSLFGGGSSGLTYILFGGIIMLIARFEPGGLMEIGRRIAARARRGRAARVASHAA
ncbi:MAG TPA: branched-chain amino acid ABC transporter permease [Stellaceae bacterium]|nr:branched-chain amino acid ABC transporter permease [Stellaceae bacterium]